MIPREEPMANDWNDIEDQHKRLDLDESAAFEDEVWVAK